MRFDEIDLTRAAVARWKMGGRMSHHLAQDYLEHRPLGRLGLARVGGLDAQILSIVLVVFWFVTIGRRFVVPSNSKE
jgi:hypothetical protein